MFLWFKSHHSFNLNHSSAHISPSAMVAHFVIYELAETKFAENIVKLRGFSKAAEMPPLLLVFLHKYRAILAGAKWILKKSAYIWKKNRFLQSNQTFWRFAADVGEGADGISSPLADRTGQKCNSFSKCCPEAQERANRVLFVFHHIL